MLTPSRSARALTAAALGLLIVIGTACTPADSSMGIDPATEARALADAATRLPGSPSDETLARLRNCESHSNYTAVSRSGKYRGAYQFSQRTWNNVAASFFPPLVNVDPIATPDFIQDAAARALWLTSGRGSWPVCGRRA
jgi:hypothetical protein